MPTNYVPMDDKDEYEFLLEMLNPKFSEYSDHEVDEERKENWGYLQDNPLTNVRIRAVVKRIETLKKEKLVRERIKERTDCGERLSKRQKPDGLASRDDDVIVLNSNKGTGPMTQLPPNTDVSTVIGWRGSSSTSSGRLAGSPPRPGLQSSSKLLCRLCEGSNSDHVCSVCRSGRKREKAAEKRPVVSAEEAPVPCEHPAQTDCSERDSKRLLKALRRENPDFLLQQLLVQQQKKEEQMNKDLLQEKEELLQQAIRQREALRKKMKDAVRETVTLRQKLKEKDSASKQMQKFEAKDSGGECNTCFEEFGDDPSRQRAHYSDCNHANTCFGCAMTTWNPGKNNCPCCRTPATLFPLRLPAKIFL